MNLEVTLAGKTFKNPVTTASGTFGSGAEYEQFVDLAALGAVTTKGVANVPWEGKHYLLCIKYRTIFTDSGIRSEERHGITAL